MCKGTVFENFQMRSRSRTKIFHRDHFFAENPAGNAKNDPETIMKGASRDQMDCRKVHHNGNWSADWIAGPDPPITQSGHGNTLFSRSFSREK